MPKYFSSVYLCLNGRQLVRTDPVYFLRKLVKSRYIVQIKAKDHRHYDGMYILFYINLQ